jgi:hypothetical protein
LKALMMPPSISTWKFCPPWSYARAGRRKSRSDTYRRRLEEGDLASLRGGGVPLPFWFSVS